MNKLHRELYRLLRHVFTVILMMSVMLNATYSMKSEREVLNEYMGVREHPPPPGGSVTVTVSKVWTGAGNHPGSVMVQLYRNGIAYGNSVTLSANNGWRHSWTGLKASSSWTVDEPDVPVGYTKAITGNARDGFVITNTKPAKPPGPDQPDKPDHPDIPDDPNVPKNPYDPSEPNTPDVPGQPDDPGRPGRPNNPSDPGVPPKTGDDANAKPWLIIPAVCAYILRYVLIVRKERAASSRRCESR